MRTKGSEVHAPKDFSCLRAHGKHPLHEKPSSSFVADVSHSTDLATMGQIDVTAYLAPAKPQARKGRAPWSVAGEAASTRALVTSGSIRANDTTLWSLSNYACEQAENPLGSPPGWWPLLLLVSFDAYRAVGRPQRFARPSSWDPTLLVCSSSSVSLCKMWVRIRSECQGLTALTLNLV